jgi:hypothetical protein
MSEELARRAVACKHWRWLPGMRCTDGSRMLRTGHDLSGSWQAWSDEHYDACACKLRPEETRDDLPDLTDPATLGCLLALVREAWGVPDLYVAPVEYVGPGPAPAWRAWAVEGPDLHVYTTSGKTEAEALVAALEAAP